MVVIYRAPVYSYGGYGGYNSAYNGTQRAIADENARQAKVAADAAEVVRRAALTPEQRDAEDKQRAIQKAEQDRLDAIASEKRNIIFFWIGIIILIIAVLIATGFSVKWVYKHFNKPN